MKKVLIVCLAVVAVALLLPGQAGAGVESTPHDLSAELPGLELCESCHAPHYPTTALTPLWNQTASTQATWIPYDSVTLDATVGDPSGSALLCLSCHDGVTVILGTGAIMAADHAVGLGGDLRDDHPVSFTYDSTLASDDGELVDPITDADTDPDTVGASAATDLPLFAGVLQCATCHNPHDNTNGSFLRQTNAGSALCTTCHTK